MLSQRHKFLLQVTKKTMCTSTSGVQFIGNACLLYRLRRRFCQTFEEAVLPTFGGVKLQRSNIRAKNPILGGSGGIHPPGKF